MMTVSQDAYTKDRRNIPAQKPLLTNSANNYTPYPLYTSERTIQKFVPKASPNSTFFNSRLEEMPPLSGYP